MDIFVDDKRRTWCATDEGNGRILLSYKDYGNTFHWLVWDSADEDSALIKAHRELRVLRYKIRALENEISEEKKESNRLSGILSRESVVFYSR